MGWLARCACPTLREAPSLRRIRTICDAHSLFLAAEQSVSPCQKMASKTLGYIASVLGLSNQVRLKRPRQL